MNRSKRPDFEDENKRKISLTVAGNRRDGFTARLFVNSALVYSVHCTSMSAAIAALGIRDTREENENESAPR